MSIQDPNDPLLVLWRQAVAQWEQSTHASLLSADTMMFESAQDIFDFVEGREREFKKLRHDGARWLLDRVKPIAAVVESLCTPVGDVVSWVFPPGKAIFTAMSLFIKASSAVSEDFESAGAAFSRIESHLRVIQCTEFSESEPCDARQGASVKLLSQILVVLGVVTKLQNQKRISAWLKKLGHAKEVATALEDLGRLATEHHQLVSAITLATVQKTLSVLTDSVTWTEQNGDCTILGRITRISQDLYAALQCTSTVMSNSTKKNREILENIQNSLIMYQESHANGKRTSDIHTLCSWLKYPDSSIKLNTLLQSRASSTCLWFLDGPHFASLKAGTTRALWLHGEAGSGKSTMLAAATRDLKAFCASAGPSSTMQSITVVHMFDALDPSQARDIRALLSSLLCQIAHHHGPTLDLLLKLHKENMGGHSQLSLDGLRRCFDNVLDTLLARLVIVIDALDEADDVAIFHFLSSLRAYDKVSLLLSSRMEAACRRELVALCDAQVAMHKSLVNIDLETVLDSQFQHGSLRMVAEADMVRTALRNGADGNFRWMVLQIQELSRISGIPTKVRERLKTLPPSLTGVYDQCLRAIPPEDRSDVVRLLSWLIYTHVPLTTRNFAQLLAFTHCERLPAFDATLQPSSIEQVLSIIGSTLVTVQGNEVRIAHGSVKDFLLGLPPTSPFYIDSQVAHAVMVRMCLAFVRSQAGRSRETVEAEYHHMTWAWVLYLAKVDRPEYAILEAEVISTLGNADGAYMRDVSMHTAAIAGSASIMRLLIDQGADPNRHIQHRGSVGTALHKAASYGHVDAVQLLLGYSIAIDAYDVHGCRALHYAAARGDLEIPCLLVKHGASVDVLNLLTDLEDRGSQSSG
ncbi:hypothetical protein FB107DRAFT_216427 [Schizophyllum commune]